MKGTASRPTTRSHLIGQAQRAVVLLEGGCRTPIKMVRDPGFRRPPNGFAVAFLLTDDGDVRVKRSELHALVWQTPLRHLGPNLGLSDVGLSKLCRRYNIPVPPVGYWT